MQPQPLPKKLYDLSKAAGVHTITLNFSGGSDEGYLNIELNHGEHHDEHLEKSIEDWAWDVYSYSGAGDGSEYGDDITYDLKTMRATISDWFTTRKENFEDEISFELEDDDTEGTANSADHTKVEAQWLLLKSLVCWAAMNEDCVSEELRAIVEHAKHLTKR